MPHRHLSFVIYHSSLLCLLLASCHHPTPPPPAQLTPITGHGRLVSVNQVLGTGTLNIDGKTVNFWWQNSKEHPAADGSLQGWQQDPALLESSRVDVPFHAAIGDTIYFKGWTGGPSHNDIFITSALTAKK